MQHLRLGEARQLVAAAMRAQAAQGGLWQAHRQMRWWQSPIAASGANLVVDCGLDPQPQVLTRLMALMRWGHRPVGWLVWPDQHADLQQRLLQERGYTHRERLWLGSLTVLSDVCGPMSQLGHVVMPMDQQAYVRYLQHCHQVGFEHAQMLTAAFLAPAKARSPLFKTFAIWMDGVVVAAITACVLPPTSAFPCLGNLLWLGVVPAWRRRGFARAITLQACSWIVAQGVDRIHVQATAAAVGLYRSIGFQPHAHLDLWGQG